MFEGKEIGLKQSCAVFVTMNPGYAGRYVSLNLPDDWNSFRFLLVLNYRII